MPEHSCEKKMKTRKVFLKPEEKRDLDTGRHHGDEVFRKQLNGF